MSIAEWSAFLESLDEGALTLAVIETIEQLLLPLWNEHSPDNHQPRRALDAARVCVLKPSENARLHALAIAKALTKERKKTLGYVHHIAESARATVVAATARNRDAQRRALAEALGKIQEHLVYRDSIAAIYDRNDEIRQKIVETLRRALESQ
jgi:hypothetical protein